MFKRLKDVLDVCREESAMLPCISALHFGINKNCALFEKIADSRGFCHSIVEVERKKLMKGCSSCFKNVILNIPEYCCKICRSEMGEKNYGKWSGICYWCHEKKEQGELYFNKVFAIGQERADLAYAIKAFKGVGGPPNAELAVPIGILVASWLFEHKGKLDVDTIIPVPSSEERIELTFDHISEILVVVHSLVDFIDINFMVLLRCSEVRLKDLRREERAEVIRGAFTVEDEEAKDAICGKSILMLDDVFTTGATTNECARVLKENGAREVYVLAISRAYKR